MPMLTTVSTVQKTPFLKNKILLAATVVFTITWLSTLLGTSNISNWLMENVLVILFLGFLAFTYRIFNFSSLSYLLICLYLCLHIYGSKYTYAENPFGYWLKDQFHFQRNHYDRIVHFSFGFMLAYPMRDYFMNRMKFPNWVGWVLPVEITLSFSCLYELIEWAVADVFFPEQGDAYLGTQGDIWDAQKDMFMAFCGAVSILLIVALLKKLFQKNNHQTLRGKQP
jgi:putative membrane protein